MKFYVILNISSIIVLVLVVSIINKYYAIDKSYYIIILYRVFVVLVVHHIAVPTQLCEHLKAVGMWCRQPQASHHADHTQWYLMRLDPK